MDKNYIVTLMKELTFPEEAVRELTTNLDKLIQTAQDTVLDLIIDDFYMHDCDFKKITPLLDAVASGSGIHRYSVDLLFVMACSQALRAIYATNGLTDSLFLDTMADFRYKLMECYTVYGIWGTFVAFWYSIFFRTDLFKLGRLEYENTTYKRDKPYEKKGIRIVKGDPVKSIHIPSEGTPLNFENRLNSYKKAYAFFEHELGGGPLVCVCNSWLLHASVKKILPASSNTVSFMGDFDIIGNEEEDTFEDMWRVFGKDYKKPIYDLPENTSMQRAYKDWLKKGGKTGSGYGVLVFDGNSIINL